MNDKSTHESILMSMLKAVELSEQTRSLVSPISDESEITSEAKPYNPTSVFFIIEDEVKELGEKLV